jgi:hypothetical protein
MLLRGVWLAICDIRSMEYIEMIDDIRTWLSIAVGILTAVVWGIMTRRKITARKEQKESAIRSGKVIKAKCVQIYRDYDTDENTGSRNVTYHGVYEYTVDGKTKRYRVFSNGGLPSFYLPLYYADSPRKVFSDYDNINLGYNLAGLLGFAAGFLTMYLTGILFY